MVLLIEISALSTRLIFLYNTQFTNFSFSLSIAILVDLKQSKIVRDATCIRDSHFGALVRFMHVLQAKFYLIVESVVISLVKN